MARVAYEVNAKIVNEKGNYVKLDGFPKTFDSDSYGGDTVKAFRRAESAYHTAIGQMTAVDNRPMQTVTLMAADGTLKEAWTEGKFPEPATFEPEPEPDTDTGNG